MKPQATSLARSFLASLFILLFMNFTDSVECPDNLSTDCSCDKQSIGLFVNCSHLSENLDDTLKYFENINLQRLTIRNVKWHVSLN